MRRESVEQRRRIRELIEQRLKQERESVEQRL
jgi:hypothetical protein